MKSRKFVALFCSLALASLTAAGCGQDSGGPSPSGGTPSSPGSGTPDTSQKVEITVGGIGIGNSADNQYWPTLITQEIEKELNITLKMVNYDSQKFSLDMASGQLCDLMRISPAQTEAVLKGKHAAALDPYLDSLCKELSASCYDIRNNLMRECYSGGTGSLYFYSPQMRQGDFQMISGTVGYGHLVRWDLYKEIGHPDITDQDDYLNALIRMHELYPVTEEGLPTYAWGHYNDAGLQTWTYQGYLQLGFCALDSNSNCLYTVNMQANEFVPNMYNESEETPFWNDMHFYNRMYKAGLMDPDCFITKGEDVQGKYTKGQYLGGINTWYTGDYNNNVKKDPGSIKGMVMLPANKYMVGAAYPAGFTAQMWFVSAASDNLERTLMLVNYFNSPEFSRMSNSGPQGLCWDYDSDGVPRLTEDFIDMSTNPARVDEYQKVGTGAWGNMCGIGGYFTLEDGKSANLWNDPELATLRLTASEKDAAGTLGVPSMGAMGESFLESGKCMDESKWNSLASALMTSAPDDITRIDSNAAEIVTNALPSLVQAENDEAFAAARDKLLSDLKAANMEQSLQWWQDTYTSALSLAEEIMK